MTQTNLIDQLEQATDKAVYAAGAFANPSWYRAAEYAVETLIRLGNDFTTDDVWEILDSYEDLATLEPRAMGSIMRQAAKDRRIIATGSYRKSMRPECHRRPLAVWRPVTYRQSKREAQ